MVGVSGTQAEVKSHHCQCWQFHRLISEVKYRTAYIVHTVKRPSVGFFPACPAHFSFPHLPLVVTVSLVFISRMGSGLTEFPFGHRPAAGPPQKAETTDSHTVPRPQPATYRSTKVPSGCRGMFTGTINICRSNICVFSVDGKEKCARPFS